MSMSSRLVLGFIAGFLSHLVFQGAFGSILYAVQVLPALPFSLEPVPPLGVPKTLSLGFWAGLWGLVYVLLEPRLTARLGWWLGGLIFGIAPLLVLWFVVQPIKGAGIGGGFHLASVPIAIGFHLVFGLGVAVFFRFGQALLRRGASPGALRG
jgi:hypothetical protein